MAATQFGFSQEELRRPDVAEVIKSVCQGKFFYKALKELE